MSCLICGRPAGDAHHYHPERVAGGKGMGGGHLPTMRLCRSCHEDVHMGRVTVRIKGALAEWERGGEVSTRALTVSDHGETRFENLPFLSDARLSEEWARGAQDGARAYVRQALAAYGFYQRYRGYGRRWYERAAEIIHDQTGHTVPARRLYEQARVGSLIPSLGDPEAALLTLGREVVKAVAQLSAEEQAGAIERAQAARDAGERMTVVARRVRGNRADPQSCRETGIHLCAFCGSEWGPQ